MTTTMRGATYAALTGARPDWDMTGYLLHKDYFLKTAHAEEQPYFDETISNLKRGFKKEKTESYNNKYPNNSDSIGLVKTIRKSFDSLASSFSEHVLENQEISSCYSLDRIAGHQHPLHGIMNDGIVSSWDQSREDSEKHHDLQKKGLRLYNDYQIPRTEDASAKLKDKKDCLDRYRKAKETGIPIPKGGSSFQVSALGIEWAENELAKATAEHRLARRLEGRAKHGWIVDPRTLAPLQGGRYPAQPRMIRASVYEAETGRRPDKPVRAQAGDPSSCAAGKLPPAGLTSYDLGAFCPSPSSTPSSTVEHPPWAYRNRPASSYQEDLLLFPQVRLPPTPSAQAAPADRVKLSDTPAPVPETSVEPDHKAPPRPRYGLFPRIQPPAEPANRSIPMHRPGPASEAAPAPASRLRRVFAMLSRTRGDRPAPDRRPTAGTAPAQRGGLRRLRQALWRVAGRPGFG